MNELENSIKKAIPGIDFDDEDRKGLQVINKMAEASPLSRTTYSELAKNSKGGGTLTKEKLKELWDNLETNA